MQTLWKLQEAKAKFSEVVNNAISTGPQHITRRGQEVVVILSAEEYRNITSPKPTFKEFLLDCPKIEEEFIFERQQDYSRDIEF
ncbi:type II toxin-antitoxin system Phd/YefM family antitoxin [Pasteurella atlantica]|uniref:Type II toxin-antitoxin system Phd/YefM family antitoxin n=2 Tax=Pasteurellaceae TaxID=712 RepID=A0ACC6HPM4_9PAST|nr:type II toxin-antitoxin system Phd/YefM family antitoxin [Pasteurella atlantica]MDP8034560.1 type II toxin-antitoxin system Phd/YefM family antitoxin [Pasteurella atlantica]MDP8036506.1 type II toxin-antitoxin system Phd/YefM family antitoxin [Pasteurella atlantica]MDP8038446.1 type II toxin-antitoxin system Phd/YefM family antitoxin [Pasteurella atlantica]MDP8048829.1 type II toxin-antitoxin system Phd/YefM family antitoxin [Pasteurella atlantica]MDP8050046.1 type II toxin-antitoxin system